MANPIDLATLFREQIGGRRNLIINGAMQVWQRGTTATGAGSGGGTYETADRWRLIIGSGTTIDSYQRAFTLGQTDVPGEPEFYLESDVTASTGSSTHYILAQRIEDVRSLAGQTATLSFWAKSSVGGNKVGIEFNQSFGGGSTRVTSAARNSVNLSTSWQKFSVTVDIPSISGKTIGTTSASYLELFLWCSAGTDFDFRSSSTPEQTGQFDFASIQLELGETATPFEHRSYAEELELCKRYYQRWDADAQYYRFAPAHIKSSTAAEALFQLRPEMRVEPTALETTGTASDYVVYSDNVYTCTGVALNSNSNKYTGIVEATTSGLTGGHAGQLISNNSNAYIAFYAEL